MQNTKLFIRINFISVSNHFYQNKRIFKFQVHDLILTVICFQIFLIEPSKTKHFFLFNCKNNVDSILIIWIRSSLNFLNKVGVPSNHKNTFLSSCAFFNIYSPYYIFNRFTNRIIIIDKNYQVFSRYAVRCWTIDFFTKYLRLSTSLWQTSNFSTAIFMSFILFKVTADNFFF